MEVNTSFDDVVERVWSHVRTNPSKKAFVFIQRRNEAPTSITWGALWSRAQDIASNLPAPTPGKKLGIMLLCRDASQFVPALLASWMRGGIAIPGSSTITPRVLERNSHIIEAAKPDVIMHDLAPDDIVKLLPVSGPALLADLNETPNAMPPRVVAAGGLLQFTSGTTSKPKPILLTPQAVAHNSAAIADAFQLSASSVGVHWLPLHHDMGLVGGVISVFWTGALSVLIHPTVFIQEPLAWFREISNWRGTITSAPNFAYARLIKAFKEIPKTNLDLSCLENLIIGGEPVQKSTVDDLIECFGDQGLSRDALSPSYGMAEATLLISSGKRIGGPCHKEINGRMLIGLGKPVSGIDVSIENNSAVCGNGMSGPLVIRGASLGRIIPEGVEWRSVTTDGSPPPIQTGDFGFYDDGELFVTGRSSNKIIIRGKNIFAEDVEQIALAVMSECVAEGVAAFAISQTDTEQLCLIIEMPRSAAFDQLALLNTRIGQALGVKLDRIVIVNGACLPRTSSGKIQRRKARHMLLEGTLDKRIRSDVSQSAN